MTEVLRFAKNIRIKTKQEKVPKNCIYHLQYGNPTLLYANNIYQLYRSLNQSAKWISNPMKHNDIPSQLNFRHFQEEYDLKKTPRYEASTKLLSSCTCPFTIMWIWAFSYLRMRSKYMQWSTDRVRQWRVADLLMNLIFGRTECSFHYLNIKYFVQVRRGFPWKGKCPMEQLIHRHGYIRNCIERVKKCMHLFSAVYSFMCSVINIQLYITDVLEVTFRLRNADI